MLDNPISRKLQEVSVRKVSLEERIAKEESRLLQKKKARITERNVGDKVNRLKILNGIYAELEHLLLLIPRSKQYNP